MLPWHLRFRVKGVAVESIDSVRFASALRFARAVSRPEQAFPNLERLGTLDVEADPHALIGELDSLAKLSPPAGLAGVLGNLRDDVLKGLAIGRAPR